MVLKILGGIFFLLGLGWLILSIMVEVEKPGPLEHLYPEGSPRALIVYHPSLIDAFQEDLTAAFAKGLHDQGWAVDRQPVSLDAAPDLRDYSLVVFGTNTYYWRPDLPTKRFLSRSDLEGKPVVGIVSGAGNTGRAERILRELIEDAHGKVIDVQPFWLWRPNDTARMSEPNKQVAFDKAHKLGASVGKSLAGAPSSRHP